jgi:hypothetical protein
MHVVRCGCGYCFEPDKLDGVTQELEVISQEEQLYRDYLAARAAQAEEDAKVAKTTAKHDPGNTVKAAEALLAEQTAMNARAELEAQDARAVAVKNRITVVRSRRRKKPKTTAPVSRPATPAPVREVLAAPACGCTNAYQGCREAVDTRTRTTKNRPYINQRTGSGYRQTYANA